MLRKSNGAGNIYFNEGDKTENRKHVADVTQSKKRKTVYQCIYTKDLVPFYIRKFYAFNATQNFVLCSKKGIVFMYLFSMMM